ncbi:MAG: SDR family oxidoreductase [Chloroflexota bacterium]|nr:SDR family oxidoreductase [Chloroflexota bacterium]
MHLRASRPYEGKSAIVTGAASGIGRAIAFAFAREGAAVALVDLDEAGARNGVDEIVATDGRAIAVGADVTRAVDCRRAVELTLAQFGSLDILINSAGIIRRASVLETDEAEWDRVMEVNLKSAFLLSKETIPHLIAAGGGAIVNIGSGWGLVGGPRAAAYCASKGAVIQLTRAMAIDHGPQNIRVNCICPGDIDTPMLRSEAEQLGESEERFLLEAAERPLRRIGKPEDVADAALYLTGDTAAFVTGTTLVVDGGGLA